MRAIKITVTVIAMFTAISLVDSIEISYKDAWSAMVIMALVIIPFFEKGIKEKKGAAQ